MRRIVLSLAILIIGGVIGGLVATQFVQKAQITTVLSDRSKEYLATDKSNSALGQVYVGDKPQDQPVGKTITVDNCFSFSVPFAVKQSRRDSACSYYVQTDEPRGSIFAYQKNAPSTDWNSVPGISMRRQATWTYTEKSESVNGHDFLTFKTKDDTKYQRSAFYRTPDSYMVISVEAATNENLDSRFEDMLKSVKIIK